MAYAAVVSVFNAIKDLLESPGISITSSTRQILHSAYNQAWFQTALGEEWCSQLVAASDDDRNKIIDEARRLQDAIEFAVATQLLHQSKSCNSTSSLNLNHLKPHVDRFAEAVREMKARIEELWEQKAAKAIEQNIMEICYPLKTEEEEEEGEEDVSEMVGLRDVLEKFMEINGRIGNMPIWISGMAGIGKTTFAKRIFHDPSLKANHECRAFVRLGKEYSAERILRSLNAQLNHKKIMSEEEDYSDVRESLWETLNDKRFLIVLDDVWDYGIFKHLQYRSGEGGKKILVTSRMETNFPSIYYCIKLRFLSEDESWELLKRKVFLEGVCPRELVEPGKKIAKKCGGLPLLINAVAPLLLREAEKNLESWNRVSEKPGSLLEEASLQISEVLLSSYNQLDEMCKFYFLYLASFPESSVVFCSTINGLWYAEGFHGLIVDYSWGYYKSCAFHVLYEKNLVISDHEESWSGREIKYCSLHIAYWYVNKRVARDNGFLYIMNSYADAMDGVVKSHHRLAIQTNVLLAITEVLDNITSISTVRSVLCTGPYSQYQVPVPCFEWKLLRVLDIVTIRFYEFPVEVVELVLLRYLALTCNANLHPSIGKLSNLQFLIVRQHWRIKRVAVESFMPVEIWALQELIHLEITGRNLPEPPHPGVVLPNLKRLLDVGIESYTKGVLDNIPKLRKLRIQIELAPGVAEDLTCFSDVTSFQCVVMNPTLLRPPPPLSVPILVGIDKLSLSGFGYPWKEMSKIDKLPNLRVLKLQAYAFRGEKWEMNDEMRFRKLQYLYIEDTDLVRWTKKSGLSMELRGLKMKNCYKLREFPPIFWSCASVKIELIDCNPLAEKCARKKHSIFDLSCSITATYSWKEKKLK